MTWTGINAHIHHMWLLIGDANLGMGIATGQYPFTFLIRSNMKKTHLLKKHLFSCNDYFLFPMK